MKFSLIASILLLSLSACSEPIASSPDTIADEPMHEDNEMGQTQEISIKFAPQINGEHFACGKSYTGIGTSQSTLTPQDFRFYVSNAQLVNEAGEKIPITLKQDGKWQLHNLALLDFEDKTGACSSGTPETQYEIRGTVPEGQYKGLSFELGIPFAMNHQDVNAADAPLNLTSLFWVWRSGYKFLRADFSTTGLPQGYFIHLGSTGCEGVSNSGIEDSTAHTHSIQAENESVDSATMPPASCTNPNRPSISLPDFEPGKHSVVTDLGVLLQDSNIDQNQADSAAGCMSSPDDLDCKPIFNRLGLTFSGAKGSGQSFFSIQ